MVPAALTFTAGIALPTLGVALPPTLVPLLLLPSLILLWRRPWPQGAAVVLLLAGILSGEAVLRSYPRDCRLAIPAGWTGEVEGRFLTRPAGGRSLPFRVEVGLAGECVEVVRASLPREAELPAAGARIRVGARWERRAFPAEERPEWAGTLRLEAEWSPSAGGDLPGKILAMRGAVQDRIAELWGEETAPMIEALVLGRREHFDAGLRDAFTVSGTIHIIAISGFHVGVIAGILAGLLRLCGLRPRKALAWAAVACWVYVIGIGVPEAGARAALLFTLLAASRFLGRPSVVAGTLAATLLLLLAWEPSWAYSVGFQLSFAGTAGLIFLQKPAAAALDALYRGVAGRPLPAGKPKGAGESLLKEGAGGLAAGIAATLPTIPFLVWHFDRISLLGIPLTILVAPIIAAVLPGVGVALLLSLIHVELGCFAAGGTALLLDIGNWMVLLGAKIPGASTWVSRGAMVAAIGAGCTAHYLLRRSGGNRIRPPIRRLICTGWGAAAVLLLPLLPAERALEIHMIDAGQGDAIGIRSPTGRWLLIDAGPASSSFDAGAREIVPYLRRLGVHELDALVLTHPHLDHIGGAPEILRALAVRGVLDPTRPHGSGSYLAVVEAAERAGSSWWKGERGRSFEWDGVRVEILHPGPEVVEAAQLEDPNDLSIVLLLRWGRAAVLLTGDAPASVEREILEHLPALTVLKVGHHGSRTSSANELLAVTRPKVALIGVGDPNSFGHPHAEVMGRLSDLGTEILRTDRDGDIQARIHFDGRIELETSR